MRRSLSICALSATLLGAAPACTSRAPEPAQPLSIPQEPAPLPTPEPPAPPPPPPTPPPAANNAPAETIDATRLEEARGMLPPPLLYASFRPEVGAFVEYEVSSKKKPGTLVRASVVGKAQRPTGEPIHQVEFHFMDVQPRTLVVLWLVGDERPFVERLAVAPENQTPISVPVDLYLDMADLRGMQTDDTEVELKGGPFAGKARQRRYKLAPSGTSEVVTSDKVPLFGVQRVRLGDDTWVARKAGTGATPELTTVPVSVPRGASAAQ